MKIRIDLGGTSVTATLDDTDAARDFAALLPLTLTLEDYNATGKIADLPRKLSTRDAPPGSDPDAGDIAYYAPWGNLAMYHRDFGYSAGLVKLGRLDGGVEALERPGPLRVTMTPFARRARTAAELACEYSGAPRADFCAPGDYHSFAFAVDPSGRLGWESNDIGGDHVVAILSERVSEEYLALLRERHGAAGAATSSEAPRLPSTTAALRLSPASFARFMGERLNASTYSGCDIPRIVRASVRASFPATAARGA